MWRCRAVLVALVVSYLMCVLLWSGTQKDELDASVLNKLQRYNVNIHDLNNKELLYECTTFQFLKNKKTPQTQGVEGEIEKNIPKREGQDANNNYDFDTPKNDNSNINKFENEDNKNKQAIQYIDGQPELQSVLKFWKDININNSIKTSEAPVKLLNAKNYVINYNLRPEQKNKRNIQDASTSKESGNIQKLLLNFLMKNQINNEDNKATTKNSNNIDKLYSDLYVLNKQKENKHTEVSQSDKTAYMSLTNVEPMKTEQYSLHNVPETNKVHAKTLNKDSIRELPTQINSNNFNDIIKALQSIKTYYPITAKDKNIDVVNPLIKTRITSSEKSNLHFNKFAERENTFTKEKIIVPTITEQKLSQNVIQEIAKTVKELVLKDIRKEIFETTSYSTTVDFLQTIPTTTKRGDVISTIKTDRLNAERTILNKFMDLFEEIKTLNLKTLIISSEIRKENVNKKGSTSPVPPLVFNDMAQPSYYNTKQYPNPGRIYNFSPQLHKFKSNIVSESVLQDPIKSTLPITVQTNNMEIPPLGIPVDKPENPINQNIIVPTIKSYRIDQYKVDHSEIKLPDVRIREEHIPKHSQIHFGRPKEPTVFFSNHKNNDRHLLNKEHFNYNTNINDKITFNRYKDSNYKGDETTHLDIPRFHEQLERGGDYFDIPQKVYTDLVDCCNERHTYSKQMVDCCNRNIASRQQTSLSNVKKQPSYDDTHYNNFLKSQQKVTDMLERILASRSRVRSVETA